MDWRFCFNFASCLIILTVLIIVNGHPVRNHKGKQHSLSKKAKINTNSHVVKKSKQNKKSYFFPGHPLGNPVGNPLGNPVGSPVGNPANLGSQEDAKKKGTIRISGPWHSDSGLDRNVDPMEDSYVKKIIASNEGLNFNKDMAEAGEVFDVNGIEDFYDKNALITYEVNGHEIPVHLKQKLTPQTQTMFPEYGHDSPSAPDSNSRTGHSYSQMNQGGHKATTFYGMSLKDMPEYKVKDTPSVGENNHHDSRLFAGRGQMNDPRYGDASAFSARHRLGNADKAGPYDPSATGNHQEGERGAEAQSQVDNLASEYEQANAYGQEDVKLGNRMKGFDDGHLEADYHKHIHPFDKSVAGLYPKLDYSRLASHRLHPDNEYMNRDDSHVKEFAGHTGFNGFGGNAGLKELARHAGLKEFAGHAGLNNRQEELLEELAHLKGRLGHSLFEKPMHSEENYQKRPSDAVQFTDRPKLQQSATPEKEQFSKDHDGVKGFFNKPGDDASTPDAGIAEDSRGVGKEYDGGKLAPADTQATKEAEAKPKLDDSSKFFEQLEKIDEDKQKHEKEQQEMIPGKLAELNTSLPSGAEKIQRFSDDEERTKAKDKLLSILGDLTSKLKGMEAAVKDAHTNERRESPSASDSKQEEMEHKLAEQYSHEKHGEDSPHDEAKGQTTTDAQALLERVSQNMEHVHGDPGQYERPHEERYQDERLSEQPDKSYAAANSRLNNGEAGDESQERVSHLISKLKQNDKPFIFNTEGIDYKGPTFDRMSKFSDEDSHAKDHVHMKYGHEAPLIERPIVSSFYHDHGLESNHDTGIDDHSFHSESRFSSDHEVTPTQRDNGASHEKTHDEEKEQETKETSEASEKRPDAEQSHVKENKPDVDDDLPEYNEVKDAAIFEENLIRKKYHAPTLHWSDDLSDEAQKEADDLVDQKTFDTRDLGKKNIPKGMNVAIIPISSLNVGKDSADLWQKESSKFDFVSPFVSKKNANFAQMIWKTSKEFGLGVAKTRDKSNWIVVAKYDTPVVSEYEKLKANIESDIPVADPYSDIARR